MAIQLPFDLPRREARGREDFVVAEANALAIALIDRTDDWPARRLILTGDAGAGKTHLAHVWSATNGALIVSAQDLPDADIPTLATGPVVVEDMDQAAGDAAREEAMFHLMNLAHAEGGTLMITARKGPRDWGLTLPDLQSRLSSVQIAKIDPPDDLLLTAVLMKHFADRQLAPTPEAMSWLLRRLARRFDAISDAVDQLDVQALAQGREINLGLVRDLQTDAPHLFI